MEKFKERNSPKAQTSEDMVYHCRLVSPSVCAALRYSSLPGRNYHWILKHILGLSLEFLVKEGKDLL